MRVVWVNFVPFTLNSLRNQGGCLSGTGIECISVFEISRDIYHTLQIDKFYKTWKIYDDQILPTKNGWNQVKTLNSMVNNKGFC